MRFIFMLQVYVLVLITLLVTGHPGGAVSLWVASVAGIGIWAYRLRIKSSRRLVEASLIHKPEPRPSVWNARF